MDEFYLGDRWCPARYIGDAVYAVFDGYGIWLFTSDPSCPDDKVYLEPEVLEQLNRFNQDVRREQK